MPEGLPLTWEQYKAYLKEITKATNYPGLWDKPERAADLKSLIEQAERILGANPEAAFKAGNMSLLIGLPYFSTAFEFASGMPLTQWYNLYTKALPEDAPLEDIPSEFDIERFKWQQQQDLWARGLQEEQFGLAEEKFAFQQQQAMLPFEQMTAFQQAQTRMSEMQQASQLAALGEEGWIQQWYARQAKGAQFQEVRKPWFAENSGLAGMMGWDEMKPNERAEWLRRFAKGQWARVSPDVQKSVLQGFGFPERAPGGDISFGAPIPPEIPAPAGATDWTRFGARGEGGVLTLKTMPSLGIEAPFPIGEAPPRETRGPQPRPTAPPTPAGLPQFAPWLAEGQPITRGEMPTPSGQLWSRTTPSERGMLRGFTKWGGAGRSFEDIQAEMFRMQPQAVFGGRGRFRAARQV